jgi:hypothetical protein
MPPLDPRFGPTLFEAIVERVLAAGYGFARFDRPAPEGKVLRLRFDVDISPPAAFLLGDILAKRGLVATFLVQLDAETYMPFAPEVLDGIDHLRAQGHAVGLHIDQTLIGDDEERIAATLDWFATCVRPIDRVVSFHRPTPAVLGRRYARFASGYAPDFFAPERYLSDSRRSLDFLPRLEAWLEEGRAPLQLLLHPEWWEGHADAAAVWESLRARRRKALEDYALGNFSKVFAAVIGR